MEDFAILEVPTGPDEPPETVPPDTDLRPPLDGTPDLLAAFEALIEPERDTELLMDCEGEGESSPQ